MIEGNPPVRCWLLEKDNRSAWYSYYPEVVADAVRDGWRATEIKE